MPKFGISRRLLLPCACLAVVLAGIQMQWIGAEDGVNALLVAALVSAAGAGALVALAMTTSKVKLETPMTMGYLERPQGADPDRTAADLEVSFGSRLEEYFVELETELSQVDRLVGDAVGNLVASYKYISNLTRRQQEISLSIAQSAAVADREPLPQLLARQTAIAHEIDQELDAAVTSLQFGDLVDQQLGHTMHRIRVLGTALQRVEWPAGREQSGSLTDKPRAMYEGISAALVAASAAGRRKTVTQQRMQRGDIELF